MNFYKQCIKYNIIPNLDCNSLAITGISDGEPYKTFLVLNVAMALTC